jgi:hypothetical protein
MDRRRVAKVLGGLAVIGGLAMTGQTAYAQVVPGQQVGSRYGSIFVQCPGDTDGDAIPDVLAPPALGPGATGGMIPTGSYMFKDTDYDGETRYYRTTHADSTGFATGDTRIRCASIAAGDGFITTADRRNRAQVGFTEGTMYILGFSDVTGKRPDQISQEGFLNANFPAPTLRLKQGEEFYLTLTNVGMVMRPDLYDPHSIHFHGFPQAAAIFDGVPESSISANMGSSITYFYNLVEPGTYMYHCHREATEHMQMGMLGNLYVEPAQNGTTIGTHKFFAYNDVDGKTGYDVDASGAPLEFPIQIGSFDPNFHDQEQFVQPLPFSTMRDKYPMLNGRGYPDTVLPAEQGPDTATQMPQTDTSAYGMKSSQPVNALITVPAGKKALLRISNLAVSRFYTLASQLPMTIVGHSARLLRGPGGQDRSEHRVRRDGHGNSRPVNE